VAEKGERTPAGGSDETPARKEKGLNPARRSSLLGCGGTGVTAQYRVVLLELKLKKRGERRSAKKKALFHQHGFKDHSVMSRKKRTRDRNVMTGRGTGS